MTCTTSAGYWAGSSRAATSSWTQAINHATHLLTDLEEEMRDYYGERSPEWKEDYKGDEHKERMQVIHRVIAALENVSF